MGWQTMQQTLRRGVTWPAHAAPVSWHFEEGNKRLKTCSMQHATCNKRTEHCVTTRILLKTLVFYTMKKFSRFMFNNVLVIKK